MADFKEINKALKAQRTPSGPCRYAWLDKTKVYDGKDTGKYSLEVVLDPDNNTAHAEYLDALVELSAELIGNLPKGKQKKANLPYAYEEDKDTGERTGYVILRPNTTTKPAVVDAKKNPVSKPVFGGSIVKVIVKPSLYDTGSNCGVKLYLNAVQVLQLASGGGDASMFDEEDGYVDDGVATAPAAEGGTDDADY